MDRIRERDLEALCQRINDITGAPASVRQPGHYYVDMAYGGYKLVMTTNEFGGIRAITSGYTTKRALYGQMLAYIAGLQSNKKLKD